MQSDNFLNISITSSFKNKNNEKITTGEVINSYTIVTTQANEVVGNIHRKKRMPVVLKPEDEEKCLKSADSNFWIPGVMTMR